MESLQCKIQFTLTPLIAKLSSHPNMAERNQGFPADPPRCSIPFGSPDLPQVVRPGCHRVAPPTIYTDLKSAFPFHYFLTQGVSEMETLNRNNSVFARWTVLAVAIVMVLSVVPGVTAAKDGNNGKGNVNDNGQNNGGGGDAPGNFGGNPDWPSPEADIEVVACPLVIIHPEFAFSLDNQLGAFLFWHRSQAIVGGIVWVGQEVKDVQLETVPL